MEQPEDTMNPKNTAYTCPHCLEQFVSAEDGPVYILKCKLECGWTTCDAQYTTDPAELPLMAKAHARKYYIGDELPCTCAEERYGGHMSLIVRCELREIEYYVYEIKRFHDANHRR